MCSLFGISEGEWPVTSFYVSHRLKASQYYGRFDGTRIEPSLHLVRHIQERSTPRWHRYPVDIGRCPQPCQWLARRRFCEGISQIIWQCSKLSNLRGWRRKTCSWHYAPPELHLLIGPVDTMFNGLKSKWPKADNWAKLCNVQEDQYLGGTFNGNSCMRLLTHVDQLVTPHVNYVNAFRHFKSVVDACYGKNLDSSYKEKIGKFKNIYMQLGLRVTPKLHTVFFHIADFCESRGLGLGFWSEQASESVHADFKKTWAKYNVRPINNRYPDQLLAAVKDYASKHI